MFDRRLVTLACLATLYLVWGSTYLAMHVAVRELPPLLLGALRFGGAGAVLLATGLVRGARLPRGAEWGASAAIGLCLMCAGLGTTTWAMTRGVSSGVAALMFGAVPLWTVLLSRGLGGQRPAAGELVGLGLGFSGVVLVAARGELRAEPIAALALCAAAAAYALGCVLARSLPQAPGPMANAAQMLVACAVLTIVGLTRGERLPAQASTAAVLSLLHLSLFGSVLAYTALAHLLRTERPALATSYAFVNPVVALALGAAIAGERVGPAELVGVVMILIAVFFVTRPPPLAQPSSA